MTISNASKTQRSYAGIAEQQLLGSERQGLIRGRTNAPAATNSRARTVSAAVNTCVVMHGTDLTKADHWTNSTKFGPYYHSQRWRFAT